MRPVFWRGMWGGFASSAYGWDACFWGVQQDAS